MNMAKITPDEMASPQKIVFIHVAKTAGTSAKKYFSQKFAADQRELALERNPQWLKNKSIEGIEQLQLLAGHLSYAELAGKLDLSDFLVVTCIRNPLEHIVSHIAHFRRFADEKYSKEFNSSSQEIQELITKLAELDLASPEAIRYLYRNITKDELLIFDNCQTRYFTKNFELEPTGQRIGFREMQFALQTLKQIDLVGDSNALQTFLGAVSQRMGWSLPLDVPKVNLNDEKYGIDIRNPAMINALWPFIHYDMALYSQRSQFLCSLKRTDIK